MSAACCDHACDEGRNCPNRRMGELPFTTRRFPRTAGEAFKTDTYVLGWEPHIKPSVWHRVRLFLRRLRG